MSLARASSTEPDAAPPFAVGSAKDLDDPLDLDDRRPLDGSISIAGGAVLVAAAGARGGSAIDLDDPLDLLDDRRPLDGSTSLAGGMVAVAVGGAEGVVCRSPVEADRGVELALERLLGSGASLADGSVVPLELRLALEGAVANGEMLLDDLLRRLLTGAASESRGGSAIVARRLVIGAVSVAAAVDAALKSIELHDLLRPVDFADGSGSSRLLLAGGSS